MTMRFLGLFTVLTLFLGIGLVAVTSPSEAQNVRLDTDQVGGKGAGVAPVVPGTQGPSNALGINSDSDFWRMIRDGQAGSSSATGANAGILMQVAPTAGGPNPLIGNFVSSGEQWRNMRNGPLSDYGAMALGGIIVLLALFFAARGRIKIEHGPAGTTIERFKLIERVGHWLTAISFIVLGLTGLNVLYGKIVLLPVIGKSAFAAITVAGKYLHHGAAFAFMAGLALIFLMWVRHNLPSIIDVKWFAAGGGIFVKGSHPPAKKFNGGQKIIFWLTILGGVSLSLSGWSLMFPFEYPMFAKTFVFLNAFGFNLPTELTPLQEQQYAQLWHSIVSIFMIVVILAHIYIGSVGMEGAFDAMGSGQVDLNWAKEHHSLWVEEVQSADRAEAESDAKAAPAE